MSTCEQHASILNLELPPEFADLSGLIETDLKVIVAALTQRASERLLLTRREHQLLKRTLWNNLAQAISDAVEPLSADRR